MRLSPCPDRTNQKIKRAAENQDLLGNSPVLSVGQERYA